MAAAIVNAFQSRILIASHPSKISRTMTDCGLQVKNSHASPRSQPLGARYKSHSPGPIKNHSAFEEAIRAINAGVRSSSTPDGAPKSITIVTNNAISKANHVSSGWLTRGVKKIMDQGGE